MAPETAEPWIPQTPEAQRKNDDIKNQWHQEQDE